MNDLIGDLCMNAAANPLPLDGIRVVEFCQTIMGPSAGLVLADLGADVIKVEPAPDGDKTRRLHGFAAGFFGGFNDTAHHTNGFDRIFPHCGFGGEH